MTTTPGAFYRQSLGVPYVDRSGQPGGFVTDEALADLEQAAKPHAHEWKLSGVPTIVGRCPFQTPIVCECGAKGFLVVAQALLMPEEPPTLLDRLRVVARREFPDLGDSVDRIYRWLDDTTQDDVIRESSVAPAGFLSSATYATRLGKWFATVALKPPRHPQDKRATWKLAPRAKTCSEGALLLAQWEAGIAKGGTP